MGGQSLPERQRALARALSVEIDRLLAGKGTLPETVDPSEGPSGASDLQETLDTARRVRDIVASFPPVPPDLIRRVQEMVGSRAAGSAGRQSRWKWALSTVGTAAAGAVVTALIFLAILVVVPGVPGGQRSLAQVIDVLLGQTRVILTPTLPGSTYQDPGVGLTPDVYATRPGSASAEGRGLPKREPLRDLVSAELLIGRAPSVPKKLPPGYALHEIAAVSYPDLPSWISQPFYVEMCYGPEAGKAACDLKLRQYRLLFREFGGISGVQVAGDAVKDMEQIDIGGTTGMLLTFDLKGEHPNCTVLWERDGLLLELETSGLSREELLEIARSVR
jgi:hypothetical protein